MRKSLFVSAALALSVCIGNTAFAQSTPRNQGSLIEVSHRAEWARYLRSQRRLHLQQLQTYANLGHFPQNNVARFYTNVFRDEQNNLCAVAYLIQQAGDSNLVNTIATTQNNVHFGEVTSGPLLNWILQSGFTQEEVAAIQEPDMPRGQLPQELQQEFSQAERARQRAHYRTIVRTLRRVETASVRMALSRLGDRIFQSPPTHG